MDVNEKIINGVLVGMNSRTEFCYKKKLAYI